MEGIHRTYIWHEQEQPVTSCQKHVQTQVWAAVADVSSHTYSSTRLLLLFACLFLDVFFCQEEHVMLQTDVMSEHHPELDFVCVCLSGCVSTHWFMHVACDSSRNMTVKNTQCIVTSFTVTKRFNQKRNPCSSSCAIIWKNPPAQRCVTVCISPYLCLLYSVRLIHINPSHTQHPSILCLILTNGLWVGMLLKLYVCFQTRSSV